MAYETWTTGAAGPDDLEGKIRPSEDVRELCPADLLVPLFVAELWGF